ncbi:hypothetical protein LTR10_009958 [Elasticomyces elasticus]|uniref:DNA damage-responsive protein 48 n=1 Tax=Elasticomyces elasticus TaxID=574655 RepID=A0AAN7WA53_9PEZI|nr:hypothetical protein LTR10_009958 [Elasticomyces elasticus]KAK4970250.1 hypothetical protein LTR42_008417 [Elasticomyces elasticus]KAK5693424.1 hypothetical protein LTR97_009993 [Elasticomyces elasticus]KAK5720164.1 hypothetical protein LTR15_007437 [Elasticomyces elasticus]
MDFVKNLAGGNNNQNQGSNAPLDENLPTQSSKDSGGFLGGLGDKINGAAGGGQSSEKNEDYLDKGIDMVQGKFMGGGDQSNESAAEQAKDEAMSDYIRSSYKSATGSDIPIKDKPTALDRNAD